MSLRHNPATTNEGYTEDGRGGSQTAPTQLSANNTAAADGSLTQDNETTLRSWAQAIDRAGLSAPAMLALHIVKPLSWISGQMLWVLQPVLDGIHIAPRRDSLSVSRLAGLLETEGGVDNLIGQIGLVSRQKAERGR